MSTWDTGTPNLPGSQSTNCPRATPATQPQCDELSSVSSRRSIRYDDSVTSSRANMQRRGKSNLPFERQFTIIVRFPPTKVPSHRPPTIGVPDIWIERWGVRSAESQRDRDSASPRPSPTRFDACRDAMPCCHALTCRAVTSEKPTNHFGCRASEPKSMDSVIRLAPQPPRAATTAAIFGSSIADCSSACLRASEPARKPSREKML